MDWLWLMVWLVGIIFVVATWRAVWDESGPGSLRERVSETLAILLGMAKIYGSGIILGGIGMVLWGELGLAIGIIVWVVFLFTRQR